VERLLTGEHTELRLRPSSTGAARRSYGSFEFRLGAASAGVYATGSWQYHRPFPAGSAAGSVRLVRKIEAGRFKWSLQFILKLREPIRMRSTPRGTLACVHFGWAADTDGRRVAAIADIADPGMARLIQLPPSIEDDLKLSADIQSRRDLALNDILAAIKAFSTKQPLQDSAVIELGAIRHLGSATFTARRAHRLDAMLNRAADGDEPIFPALREWVRNDRMQWQAGAGIARRARNRRRDFYRQIALGLARDYSAIALEPLDLAEAAVLVDERTGKKTEFTKAARAGRVVAAIYEFEAAIRWAAAKHATAVFDVVGLATASQCAHCGSGALIQHPADPRMVQCPDCGAEADRKRNGAAVAWAHCVDGIEGRIVDWHADTAAKSVADKAAAADRKAKMAEGRRSARAAAADQAEEVREESCIPAI
jgi:hypothetical protein